MGIARLFSNVLIPHLSYRALTLFFLQALDVFLDLDMASLDYAEARSNDDFMTGDGNGQSPSISPVLDIAKPQKIKVIVDMIKMKQTWKALGGS
jgi:hypothetical protein